MARTPEQWLDVLAKRLDARMPYVTLMRRYRTGDAPLPEMGPRLRASWEAFQRKSRANWGGFAVESRADRIVYAGVTVGGSVETDEAKAAARPRMMQFTTISGMKSPRLLCRAWK